MPTFLQVAMWHFFLLFGIASVIFLFLSKACSVLFELRVGDGRNLLTSETPGSCVRVQPMNCRHRTAARRGDPHPSSADLSKALSGCSRQWLAWSLVILRTEQRLLRETESLSGWRRGSVGMTTPGFIERLIEEHELGD